MERNGKILVIDNDITELNYLQNYIKKFGFKCVSTNCSENVLDLVTRERPNIVIAELRMPKKDGIAILKEIKKFDSDIICMLLTSNGSINSSTNAFRFGAFDCLRKPVKPEQLEAAIYRAMNQKLLNVQKNLEIFEKLETVVRRFMLKKQLPDSYLIPKVKLRKYIKFENIIGKCKVMQDVFHQVEKIAQSDANVMIFGESGTGKELIARSIHNTSPRSTQALIPVDCVALPENLLESELFGYEKGAFTGAESTRRGLLEYAHNGTLFLDEIVELNPNLQAKLLRVLQEGEFRRIGGKQLIRVNLRIISASNIEPTEAIKIGKLRTDLYYRLNVIPLEIPPLRERKEDIPLLVNYFLQMSGKPHINGEKILNPDVMDALFEYSWPGNVRELHNMVERLVSLADGPMINVVDLPDYITSAKRAQLKEGSDYFHEPLLKARKYVLQQFEKEYLINLLKKCNGNISKAAQLAVISRRTLYRMINTYDLHNHI